MSLKASLFVITLVASATLTQAQETVNNRVLLFVLSLDGDQYLTSPGGKTANGCEAWATLIHSGEYIYVAYCDEDRLEALGLYITSARIHNGELETQRQVVLHTDMYMIDYVDLGFQSLLGKTANNAVAYVVMDGEKKPIHYRVEGSKDQLMELGFNIPALARANNSLETERRLTLLDGHYNVAERIEDRGQMLIGKAPWEFAVL